MEGRENKNQIDISALFQEAGICFQHGRLAEAKLCIKKILEVSPDYADANHLLGLIAGQNGEYVSAARLINRAISSCPRESLYHYNLGCAWLAGGQPEKALAAFDQTIHLDPDHVDAHNNRGNVLRGLGRPDEALAAYDRAVQLNPADAEVHYFRGKALTSLDRLEEALVAYNHAIMHKPDYVKAHNNRGNILRHLGRPEEALAAYEQVIKLHPEFAGAHYNYGMLLLLMGHLGTGWAEYEWRWKSGSFTGYSRDFKLPAWNGSHLSGKSILIYAEQGIGDEIMFSSCIPDVVLQAGSVIVECDRRLEPLIHRSFPSVITRGGKQNAPTDWATSLAPDFQLPIGSLPQYLRNDVSDFPRQKGYLKADPELELAWKQRLSTIGEGIKVGISWRGGGTELIRIKRSIPLKQWKSIATLSGVELVNLQYGDLSAEITEAEKYFSKKIHHWDEIDLTNNLEEFAALISMLDLVISVDNSTVHMAGALGKKTWVLLPYSPDWRWLLEREDSPWYPSMRLFRQPVRGDWQYVFKRVRVALEGGLPL